MTARPLGSLPLLDSSAPVPIDRPFLLADALRAGASPHRVRMLEQHGLIRRVIKSVYVAAQLPDDLTTRARALHLVVPREAVVTDWTACWFWTGVLKTGDHRATPPLSIFHTVPHRRLRNDLCASGARALRPSDIVDTDDLRVTTPLRTAWDLGRLAHRDNAIGALDALLRHGSFGQDELLEGVERFKGMRGVVQLRALAPLADPRSESPGESTLRLRWLDIPSIPPPTPQVSIMVNGVEVYRIDLGVEELQYGCEYDGADFHPLDDPHDKARRSDLLQRFGWDVDAARRENVFGVHRNIEEILHVGIRRARRSRGRRPSYEG
jgi:hypothetical protein